MEARTKVVETPDEELMLRYREDDAKAFEALYSRHKNGLYRYLLRQCRDQSTCQELFQDIWLAVIRNRKTYEVRARFTTYLYKMAHNRLIDYYRKKHPAALSSYTTEDADPLDNIPGSEALMPENVFAARQRAQRLLKALETLPEAQREAFLLREEGGISLAEAAEITGVKIETAKSRLRYALSKLRKALEPAT